MKAITSGELRELYQRFFESKEHSRIASAPLVPQNDPSVLFTTAGMHPLVPYLKGQAHPQGSRLVDVQKCLRTTDIDDVGDATHATVFEMLGNWSLGDYFKQEAISWSWEFLTSQAWLGLPPDYLAVSVFAGDNDALRDEESALMWQKMGVSQNRIAYLPKKENWWPAGGGVLGPQGPDTEIFYWIGEDEPPVSFEPSNSYWVEIWNNVFMEFDGQTDGSLVPLSQQNVDTGMGLERTIMVLNGLASIYEIDSYRALMSRIKSAAAESNERHIRIVADHIKAATFLLGDESPVVPDKTDQGYVLRRIIRRAIRSARVLGISNATDVFAAGLHDVIHEYRTVYPSLDTHATLAETELRKEIGRFERVLVRGLHEMDAVLDHTRDNDVIAGEDAFTLYERHGFPIELVQEIAGEHKKTVDRGGFEEALKRHQHMSRMAAQGKFAGGLADHSLASVKYHTATHLLHQALRTVLGGHVLQKGSNITAARLRFDFSHSAKMIPAEIEKVEKLINDIIARDLAVTHEEMTVSEAKKLGALGLFEEKYADRVSVYRIGDFSIEICGGPHVEHTGTLGTFRITKEESAGAGIRRIKAVLS